MGQCPCFGSAQAAEQERRAEADRRESQDARAKAAEAAQRRQAEYDKSAAGRAAKAQMKAMKESKTSNQGGEPVLKWQMGSLLSFLLICFPPHTFDGEQKIDCD